MTFYKLFERKYIYSICSQQKIYRSIDGIGTGLPYLENLKSFHETARDKQSVAVNMSFSDFYCAFHIEYFGIKCISSFALLYST